MYTVFIRGLEYYAYHGVPAEERVVGHRYRVSAEMLVDGTADDTDKIAVTVDYSEVAKLIGVVLGSAECHTLERLCELVADRVLAQFAFVAEVTVEIEKPMPPMPAIADAAGVRLTRRR